MNSNSY